MILAVFDIDGTLLQSMQADARCYTQALHELGLDNGARWAECRDTTDPGIFRELFFEVHARAPTAAETRRFKQCFFGLLNEHCAREAFIPVPGADAMLAALAADPAIAVAYGTGAWRRSAQIKSESAGLPLTKLPGATGDDAVRREDIVLRAVARARAFYRVAEFDRLVYVGDGVWDVAACRRLGIPFVGVGDRAGQASLRRVGAESLVSDFTDHHSFRRLLGSARAPLPSD